MNILSVDILADIQFIDYWDAEFFLNDSGADSLSDVWNIDMLLNNWDGDALLNDADSDSLRNGGNADTWFWMRNTQKN